MKRKSEIALFNQCDGPWKYRIVFHPVPAGIFAVGKCYKGIACWDVLDFNNHSQRMALRASVTDTLTYTARNDYFKRTYT